MSIRVLSFDFWNTLYRNRVSLKGERTRRLQHFFIQNGIAPVDDQDVLHAMDTAWQIWDGIWLHERRTLDVYGWLPLVLEQLHRELSDSQQEELCNSLQEAVFAGYSIPIEGVLELIPGLAKSYGLAIISDTGIASGKYLSKLLARDGITEAHIPCRIYSDEVGKSKPDAELFHRVLKHYSCLPREMVHIGDLKQTDVAGATALGIHTIRFTGIHNDATTDLYPEAEAVIDSYAKLLETIKAW